MTEPAPDPDRLEVAVVNNIGFIHVIGRGSFKVGTGMKQFGMAAIARGCRRVVVDMAECTGMDSTFMGVLAGLAFRLKAHDNGELLVVNLSPRTRNLLVTLGLDQVVSTYMAGATPREYQAVLDAGYDLTPIAAGGDSRETTARTILEAHENLVNLSPENLPRFQDVLTFLREDLRNAPPSV